MVTDRKCDSVDIVNQCQSHTFLIASFLIANMVSVLEEVVRHSLLLFSMT